VGPIALDSSIQRYGFPLYKGDVAYSLFQNQGHRVTNRKRTFETALIIKTIMNEPSAQRAQGRSGFSAGQGSIPKASASRTSSASSCSSSSTDCAAMHCGSWRTYMRFTHHQRMRNKALKVMACSEIYE